MSLAICADWKNTNLIAAVFYENGDRTNAVDSIVGKAMCQSLLKSFIENYSHLLDKGGKLINTALFEGFIDHIHDCKVSALNNLIDQSKFILIYILD